MGNWKLTRAQEPTALSAQARREMRNGQPAGLSRRQLIRRSVGAGVGLWLLEVGAGTIGFLWPNLSSGFGGEITLVDIDTVSASPAVHGITLKDGAPAYSSEARAYIQLVDPSLGFQNGDSPDGSGVTTIVRTLYQRCPHLGCKPNFCDRNYWFECPCHGSRYDRLGIKALGTQFGPAPRSMDRFSIKVSSDGTLILDTSKITQGPLPIAVGPPGSVPTHGPCD